MVTQNIKSAVTSAEKVLDGMEDIASSATGQEKSQEEIEIQNLERTAKKVINSTLNTAVDIEKAFTKDSSWGSASDWSSKAHMEEILW
ncbi:hypothetical protein SAMN02745229_03911 [Butyrivibrio fibrisolvens DSM 3071]|uniref:Uncharacterized protein n=1 Tax=Butyrivibrio fibrisolvens DSM 3071 TaxID=1121131 RepID=A0A1M6FGU1_BUTFI|nr:hypothetical protein [Butyrivibrio fibrisolvens]SHI96954.1 hypothetical protein SAMN02745229_03911 [Butyrivibrio fibrisolvens DSM 3071]